MKEIIKIRQRQHIEILKELKEKWNRNKFVIAGASIKDGDILVCVDSSNSVSQYFIYKRGTTLSDDYVEVYYGLDLDDKVNNTDFNDCYIYYDRKATDDEVLDFHRILRHYGYYWDNKTNELKEL